MSAAPSLQTSQGSQSFTDEANRAISAGFKGLFYSIEGYTDKNGWFLFFFFAVLLVSMGRSIVYFWRVAIRNISEKWFKLDPDSPRDSLILVGSLSLIFIAAVALFCKCF